MLGRLSDAEREEIESRIVDDDFDNLLQEAEADLLDDWARGCLSPQDSDAVRRRFPAEKRQLAKLMAQRSGPVASRRDKGVGRWLAAAAMLCVISAGAYWLTRSAETPPREPVVRKAEESKVQVLALLAPATRGATAPVFRLSRDTAMVRITVQADGRSGKHSIEIESAGAPIRKESTPSGGILSIDVPASGMPAGDCNLLVFEPGGALVATYAFRLVRD
ncbi:MAG: hypothetical protein JNL62_12350 [Bryobacterales bacterium]|nr:hypothetical protein [Bryobacterales bacterium]